MMAEKNIQIRDWTGCIWIREAVETGITRTRI